MGGRCTFGFLENDEFYATGCSLGSFAGNQGTPFLPSLFSVQEFQTTLGLNEDSTINSALVIAISANFEEIFI